MMRRNFLFRSMTVLLILVILFCTTETVMGQSKADSRREKQYYAEVEKVYLSDMKQILEEKGFCNSGVTIRWVSDGEGTRNYTVMIHHRRIDMLDEDEREVLRHELMKTEFEDNRCSFQYEFLLADM